MGLQNKYEVNQKSPALFHLTRLRIWVSWWINWNRWTSITSLQSAEKWWLCRRNCKSAKQIETRVQLPTISYLVSISFIYLQDQSMHSKMQMWRPYIISFSLFCTVNKQVWWFCPLKALGFLNTHTGWSDMPYYYCSLLAICHAATISILSWSEWEYHLEGSEYC